MRYRSGSVNLSPAEDDPILWQVVQSRYISHEQLWKCARLRNVLTPRSSFNWRISRLVEHGFLCRLNIASVGECAVYSMCRAGMEYLASRGACVADFDWKVHRPGEGGLGTVLHSLGLNDIYLRLKNTGALCGWRWETEIRTHNELSGVPYGKDYDAIAEVDLGGREVRFALEYERMAKSASRYCAVRKLIEGERHLEVFLYLATHYNVLSFVRRHFEYTRQQVYFGLLHDFADSALDMGVVDSRNLSSRFSEVLRKSPRP